MQPSAQLLTPRGAGAVAVIELRCDVGIELRKLLSAFSAEPPRDMDQLPIGRIVFGKWRGEDVVVVRINPDLWEIHCHGGMVAIERVLSDLESAGASRIDEPFPRNNPNITDEAAISAHIESILVQCRTRKTASLALSQTDGRLDRIWRDLSSQHAETRGRAEAICLRWQHVADHLIVPWTIALIGPPNAGKSSLMNAIAGRQRAIVSEIPGTTRDLLEAEVFLDGWPFLFVDSAGIRETAASSIEASGISKSKTLATSADIVCVVIDQSSVESDTQFLETLSLPDDRACVLFNKSDLTSSTTAKITLNPTVPTFSVSAVTGGGLSEFLHWLVRKVIPDEPDAETVLPLLP